LKLNHQTLHLVDKSSIITVESRNETYSLKIQRYSQTDSFPLPSKWLFSFVHLYYSHD